ncbi:amidohydrolase family protein, partial [Candidatus Bipolaricaulota bacterium]|nr:amidohydrolase family protein [Candidatus Bipolaricaulota bacterium]
MMKPTFQFKLIRSGYLYDPKERGVKDVLIAGDRIARIGEAIDVSKSLEVSVFDASGRIVVPGFIDLHVHLLGGGGEAGPASRVPE